MKYLLLLLIFTVTLQAAPIDPATDKSAEARVSAIAAKFCDVYSRDPSRVEAFTIGSSVKERLSTQGIIGFTIICVDGFTHTFQTGDLKIGKTKSIAFQTPEEGVIYFSDDSSVVAKWYQCSARPVSFIIYREK